MHSNIQVGESGMSFRIQEYVIGFDITKKVLDAVRGTGKKQNMRRTDA
jgi:hypothetical protein